MDRLHLSETNETNLKTYAEEIINQINNEEVEPQITLASKTMKKQDKE